MPFKVEKAPLEGVVVVRADVFPDQRGYFMEVFRKDLFEQLGLPGDFVQLNHSASTKGVVRGLHFQWEPPMSKLMRVTVGAAYLAAVDIRKGSPALGKWFAVEASAENKIQLWAQPGFARGFCVVSDYAEIQYLCTGTYNPKGESGILWNDPAVAIDWPVTDPILSDKDKNAQTLAQWLQRPESENFKY